jgi:hypothetical protein
MSEERFPGDLLESQASSTKVALGVAGIVLGLGLLVCGGVAGYVALTTADSTSSTHSTPAAPSDPPTGDRESLWQVARSIVAIDIPVGLEPFASTNGQNKGVMFRRKGGDGTSLP